MRSGLRPGLNLPRLRGLLLLLFVALAVPSAILVVETQGQLKWEAFHHHRGEAEALSTRIDVALSAAISAEEARGYGEYAFLVAAGDPTLSNLVQRSPLAAFPVQSDVPGVLGYFQVDDEGRFTSPLLPQDVEAGDAFGIAASEWQGRVALHHELLGILSRNVPIGAPPAREGSEQDEAERALASAPEPASAPKREDAGRDSALAERESESEQAVLEDADDARIATAQLPAEPSPSQVAFDHLNAPEQQKLRAAKNELGSVDSLQLGKQYQNQIAEQRLDAREAKAKDDGFRAARKEQSVDYPDLQRQARVGPETATRIRTFESEIGPFEFSLLDDRHAVFYRNVWREGRRLTQGFVVTIEPFFEGAFARPFRDSGLAPMSDLLIAYQGDVVKIERGGSSRYGFSRAESLRGELLHQVRLSEPFGKFQLIYSIRDLPAGPGARVIGWAALVLFGVLVLGFYALYRLGARQITLARQQQDFVSAVSHELKTPLTSIRMYGEMLREGWAGEEKRREYYRFIHEESERLSRLIDNVLQLARLERQGLRLDLKPVALNTVFDLLRSKVQGLAERAGFTVTFRNDLDASTTLLVDTDALMQIVLNLVENAVKFSAKAERREIEISARPEGRDRICLGVRDYGPGIERSQLKRIFELFYRPGSELTRETTGTGIGLALVRQLARAMHGEAEVLNREPGAEFRIVVPAQPVPP